MMHRNHNRNEQVSAGARLALLLFLGLLAFGEAWGNPIRSGINSRTSISSLPKSCQALGSSSRETSELILSATSHPSVDSYHAVAEYFAQRNELGCAIAAYDLALEVDPRAWRTRYAFGLTLMQTDDSDRAAKELRAVVEQEPDS